MQLGDHLTRKKAAHDSQSGQSRQMHNRSQASNLSWRRQNLFIKKSPPPPLHFRLSSIPNCSGPLKISLRKGKPFVNLSLMENVTRFQVMTNQKFPFHLFTLKLL
ncbi:hypothetical protein CEXT_624131 [Caerostris extrusa]|uniref:Uncharacterized protein n=1 Tax=Caerostris extrusa TaxID=172846 RepID=A0AAV4MZF6_CAEEX|nr:hypothetical protein CEXT_624131 [Caerostris extrusa]